MEEAEGVEGGTGEEGEVGEEAVPTPEGEGEDMEGISLMAMVGIREGGEEGEVVMVEEVATNLSLNLTSKCISVSL